MNDNLSRERHLRYARAFHHAVVDQDQDLERGEQFARWWELHWAEFRSIPVGYLHWRAQSLRGKSTE